MSTKTEVTDEYIDEIIDAFNRQDLDAIASYFADDGIFRTARGVGIEGTCLRGPAEIREFLANRWTEIPDLHWESAVNHRFGTTFAVSEWHVVGTPPSGEKIDWLGCDIFEFGADGKIVRKDTYWKGPAS